LLIFEIKDKKSGGIESSTTVEYLDDDSDVFFNAAPEYDTMIFFCAHFDPGVCEEDLPRIFGALSESEDCIRDADQIAITSFVSIFSSIYSAAQCGGTYYDGPSNAFGLFYTWRAIAEMLGMPDASFDEIFEAGKKVTTKSLEIVLNII